MNANHTTCTVAGCTLPSRSGKASLCSKHYHRWYRHGSTDITASTHGHHPSLGRRYVLALDPSHPLAGKGGRVYEHRRSLYDAIGPGPHPCHWCGKPLNWGGNAGLYVDHLDNDGANNDIGNLVACCPRCNSSRAANLRAAVDRLTGALWTGCGAETDQRTRPPVGQTVPPSIRLTDAIRS